MISPNFAVGFCSASDFFLPSKPQVLWVWLVDGVARRGSSIKPHEVLLCGSAGVGKARLYSGRLPLCLSMSTRITSAPFPHGQPFPRKTWRRWRKMANYCSPTGLGLKHQMNTKARVHSEVTHFSAPHMKLQTVTLRLSNTDRPQVHPSTFKPGATGWSESPIDL